LKILPIFTEQNEGVYAVHHNDELLDALETLQERWSDPEYVYQYFKDNRNLLDNPRYRDFTIQEAAMKTLEDAMELFDQLENYAKTGFENNEQNLSDFFKPLHKNETNLPAYQASKTYGVNINDSWLRLYAIRLDVNCYIITGGGIKMVDAMQDVPYLAQQLEYIKLTQNYLEEQQIIFPEDLNHYEH
jgi:hypothetical protein